MSSLNALSSKAPSSFQSFEWTSSAVTVDQHDRTLEYVMSQKYYTSISITRRLESPSIKTSTVQYRIGDTIHYHLEKMGKLTGFRREFLTSEDRLGILRYGRPGVIVELFETLNGPDAGVNATIHRFSQTPGSQVRRLRYKPPCPTTILLIQIRTPGE